MRMVASTAISAAVPWTGRLSARFPLQNIPQSDAMRSYFVAGPGKALVVADYSQLELRVMRVQPEPCPDLRSTPRISDADRGDLDLQLAQLAFPLLQLPGQAVSVQGDTCQLHASDRRYGPAQPRERLRSGRKVGDARLKGSSKPKGHHGVERRVGELLVRELIAPPRR